MKTIPKILLFLAFIAFTAVSLSFAVPASPAFFEAEQPDGEKITLRMQGDEFYGWTEDDQGYTVVRDTGTKEWFYAEQGIDGNLQKTSHRVGRGKYPGSLGIEKHLKKRNFREESERRRKEMEPAGGYNAIAPGLSSINEASGAPQSVSEAGPVRTFKHLVILVQFSDKPFKIANPKQAFENYFNQVGYSQDGARGSVKDFYNETSYGMLNVDSVVTDVIQLSSTNAYYTGTRYTNASAMVTEAFTKLNATGFSFAGFDETGNGTIGFVTVIHSGAGMEAGGDSMWSHASYVTTFTTWDGKRLSRYNTIPELRMNGSDGKITAIGVSCHELGHAMLSLPDLYDTTNASQGVGNFCLMGGGSWNYVTSGGTSLQGNSPSHLSAWCKIRLGYASPTTIVSDGDYSLSRAAVDNTAFYKFSGASFNAKEYFLIENRQGTGFDAGLPGPNRGILIWHIDDNMSSNTNLNHYWVAVETADGSNDLAMNANRGTDKHYFRAGNKTDFTDSTNPNSLSYAGLAANMPITNISSTGATMTFRVGSGGGIINSIAPASSKRGVTVNIEMNGSGLLSGSKAKLVKGTSTINASSVTYNSASKLTALFAIPSTATIGYWDLIVSSAGYPSDVTKPGIFLVQGDMSINSVTPNTGYRGTTLNINVTGTDFQNGAAIKLTSGTTVINGTGVTLSGSTGITASFAIPSTVANNTQFDLTITNASGDYITKTQAVTIYALTITSFTPAQANVGDTVNLTVNGTGFIPGQSKIILKNSADESITITPDLVSVSSTQMAGTFTAVSGTWKVYASAYESGPEIAAASTLRVAGIGTVDSIIPGEGKRNTTVSVEINGTNLLAGSAVTLTKSGSTAMTATSVVYNSPNKITAAFNIANNAAIGYWDLTVSSTGYARDITKAGIFLVFSGNMSITGVTPSSGTTGTTLNLTINGAGFANGLTVKMTNGATVINGTNVSRSGNKATASFAIPFGIANGTKFDVTVTNPDGDYATSAQAVTIYGGALSNGTITSITPAESKRGLTVNMTINGTNLLPGSTAILVRAGSSTMTATSVTFNSASQLTAAFNIPSAATIGTWDLVVSSTGYVGDIIKTGIFLVLGDSMSINSVTPNMGIRGMTLTLTATGTDFQTGAAIKLTSGTTVINGSGITYNGTTGITALFAIPSTVANGTQFNLTITNPSGDYITKTQAVTIYTAPTVTGFTPLQASTGAAVNLVVTGTGFIPGYSKVILKNASNESVTIIPSTTSVTATQITGTFTAPSSTGAWKVYVAAYDGGPEYAAASNLNVTALTSGTITSIMPTESKRGLTVNMTINGTNLLSGSTARLVNGANTIAATSTATYISSNQLTATFAVPSTATLGTWDLVVSNTGYASDIIRNGIFTVQSNPQITSTMPDKAVAGENFAMTINGSDYQNGATVMLSSGATSINGNIQTLSASAITANFSIPVSAAQLVRLNLNLTNPDGISIVKSSAVTVYKQPDITSINKSSGAAGTQASVILTGINFTSDTKIVLKNASNESITMPLSFTYTSPTSVTITFTPSVSDAGQWKIYSGAYEGSTQTAYSGQFNVYMPEFAINTITPTESKRGVTVNIQINGTNLLSGSTAKLVRGASTIMANAVAYNSSSQITATFNIPSAAAVGAWDLVLSSTGYTSDLIKTGFFIRGDMTISNVTPNIGIKGTTLTLTATGTDFQSGATIKLTNGGTTINGSGIIQSGTTGITASFAIPSTVTNGTQFDLTITNTSGDYVTKTQAVTVYNALTLTNFTPTQASTGAAVNLTVNGTGFLSEYTKVILKNASNNSVTIVPGITSVTATKITGTFTSPNSTGTWKVCVSAYENGPEYVFSELFEIKSVDASSVTITLKAYSGGDIIFKVKSVNGSIHDGYAIIPEMTFDKDVDITVQQQTFLAQADSNVSALKNSNIGVSINAKDDMSAQGIILKIPYTQDDIAAMEERSLVIAVYDEAKGVWTPLKSTIDKDNNLVCAQIDRLGIFAIMGIGISTAFDNIKYYPNPIRPSKGLNYAKMNFANLPAGTEIKIYTQTGRAVRKLEADGAGMAVWDAKNASGEQVASGVYIAYFEDKSGNKKKIRIAVER